MMVRRLAREPMNSLPGPRRSFPAPWSLNPKFRPRVHLYLSQPIGRHRRELEIELALCGSLVVILIPRRRTVGRKRTNFAFTCVDQSGRAVRPVGLLLRPARHSRSIPYYFRCELIRFPSQPGVPNGFSIQTRDVIVLRSCLRIQFTSSSLSTSRITFWRCTGNNDIN